MPIVQPPSFTTLNLVPFQINPHYTDFHPPNHRGETRADRLREFLELNRQEKVVAIREGSILRREGDKLSLLGDLDALLFQFGHEPRPLKPGEDLSFLLQQETL
jgi:dipeptidase E